MAMHIAAQNAGGLALYFLAKYYANAFVLLDAKIVPGRVQSESRRSERQMLPKALLKHNEQSLRNLP